MKKFLLIGVAAVVLSSVLVTTGCKTKEEKKIEAAEKALENFGDYLKGSTKQ